jgi:CheY-like chemotaxis protein
MDENASPNKSVETSAKSESAAANPLRVLVVDDNHDNVDCCLLLFRRSGFEVRAAYSGPEALAVAAEFQPHAMLLDIGMPEMSGYEVARHIRATPWGSATMLIAVSGWGQEGDKQQAIAAGFNHHVTKPIDFPKLQSLLASAAH